MPILREGEIDIISHSPEQTKRFGARLGKLLRAGDIVCLSGNMGAGKTMFTSGIGQGWGSLYPVTSPTYTIVHQHRRKEDKLLLYHLDCYRLESAADVDSIGFDEILDNPQNILIIEWAEHLEAALPKDHLWIDFRVVDDTRRAFNLEGRAERYTDTLAKFRDATFGK